jgi:hypothetical protein
MQKMTANVDFLNPILTSLPPHLLGAQPQVLGNSQVGEVRPGRVRQGSGTYN